MNKIEKEELQKIKDQQMKTATMLNEIGYLESRKHQLLHDVAGLNDMINVYKKELTDKYGDININLEDGSYTPVDKLAEADV
tara:strand:+ start:88 stop:333 length:246 start_codon:yes stop_codon:yes gene_type:complete